MSPRSPRIALRTGPRASALFEEFPTPLVYGGGFLNKTLVFETLVQIDARGQLHPGLADSWSSLDGGRTWTFRLRPGARFHDGSPCDARAVSAHFGNWIGGADDAFIPAATRIADVAAEDDSTVTIRLDEPLALPYDLAIVNPMAIVSPEARRGEARPTLIGSGPFRIVEYEPMRRFRLERWPAGEEGRSATPGFDLELFVASSPRDSVTLWALERGRVDAVVEDWAPAIPRAQALELEERGFVVEDTAGSAVVLLDFNTARAPFADRIWRLRAAAAIDRAAMIEEVESGLGDPVHGLFAPWVCAWPQPDAVETAIETTAATTRAELVVPDHDVTRLRLASCVQRDLRGAGIEVDVRVVSGGELSRRRAAGEYDLCFEGTWGVPYDPQTTLHARFGPQPVHPTAVESPAIHRASELDRMVLEYIATIDPEARGRIASRIQSWLDDEVALVPLYAPRRILVRRPELEGLHFGEHGYELDVRDMRLTR